MTRDEFTSLTLDAVRTRAAGHQPAESPGTGKPVLGGWAALAAAMETKNAGTVADLDPDAIERHYVGTRSQYAELTPQKIARAMKDPDLSEH